MMRDAENLTSVFTPGGDWNVDEVKCTGCGDCVVICPVGALKLRKGKVAMIEKDSCCGESCCICEYHCWKDAITAYR